MWLMTDERQGDALWDALARLPRGSGVVFRHHRTEAGERAEIHKRIARIARRRGLVVAREVEHPLHILLSESSRKEKRPHWIARVHSQREAIAARRAGAAAIFVSPVFATRTHPGQPPLGPVRAMRIAQAARLPSIALGGMTARRFNRLRRCGFIGWAAIDAFTR